MSVSNNKVTEPVGLLEVTQLLGEKSVDVGTDCTSDSINPYAKYKPIVWGLPSILTDNQRYVLNHGFTPTSVGIVSSPTKMPAWGQWRVPDPENGEWCRITDFLSEDGTKGYNHKAQSYVKGLRVETNHQDGTSIVINNNLINGVPPANTQQENLLKGEVSFILSLNPDAELKFTDFHWDTAIGGDLKDMYFCVALISPWQIQNGTSAGSYWFSNKIGNITGEEIRCTFPTAPNETLWTAMTQAPASNRKLLLVAGIVNSNQGSPTEFLSPVIFKDWEVYDWLKTYTSYAAWNGRKISNPVGYYGGFYNNSASLTLPPVSSTTPLSRYIVLSGVNYQVWRDNGGSTPDAYTKVRVTPHWSIQLRHTDGTTFEASGDITIGETSNSKIFTGESNPNYPANDILGTITVPKSGTYSGMLRLWVDNSYSVPTTIIGGEVAIEDNIERRGNYNNYGASLELNITSFYIG